MGSDQALADLPVTIEISIHAPRMGSDSARFQKSSRFGCHFNPRSPHGERQQRRRRAVRTCAFQSTLPAWGATFPRCTIKRFPYFNPRSPHGERPMRPPSVCWNLRISIHAPRMGSDWVFEHYNLDKSTFQSTLPAWGATATGVEQVLREEFQSTLPAWGATVSVKRRWLSAWHFNPRSPHGERRTRTCFSSCTSQFQSTLPAWGATSARQRRN